MQQPGLQQTPAGWPGMPGLQSPPLAQPQPQVTPQPVQGYPGQSYQVYPPAPSYPPGFPPGGQLPPSGLPSFPVQAQPQFQTQHGLQPQAPPVSPVSFPASPYGGPQAGQQAPPNPAQALARQLIDLARTLEQLIPGYQMAQSILLELTSSPTAFPVPGLDEALLDLRDALHYHGASLGAIRRILCGETTPAVLTNLATAFQSLSQVHARSASRLDRLIPAAPLPLRASLTSLAPSLSAADAHLTQAGTAIQALVGPQVWEASRSRPLERGSAGKKREMGAHGK